MTTVALIPGAGGVGWYWHLVAGRLRDRGHEALPIDLAARGRVGLPAYADAVVEEIGGRPDVALVAQSMGAFTAPLVWQRVPTRCVVFVNAMIPVPGETPGQWWDDVGSEPARTAAAGQERQNRAFNAYAIGHVVMTMGIVVTAAGIADAIHHLGGHAQPWLLGGGAAAFLAGHALHRMALGSGRISNRLAGAVLAVPVGLLAVLAGWAGLAGLTVLLAVVEVVDRLIDRRPTAVLPR